MNREDIAYIVNTTPKYFYLLPLHFALIRRYAAKLKWPVYIATEVPQDPVIQKISKDFGVEVLPLDSTERYFLESRLAAVQKLPETIKYVFPIQEDFLLQARPDYEAIEEAMKCMEDPKVASVRLMPCPGPQALDKVYAESQYKILDASKDTYMFTFQATLWHREDFTLFFSALLDIPEALQRATVPQGLSGDELKKYIQIQVNLAENQMGQRKFCEVLGDKKHLAYPRAHPKPNAVYLSPWPYRPTAVERGKLGEWVKEFSEREGYPL